MCYSIIYKQLFEMAGLVEKGYEGAMPSYDLRIVSPTTPTT